MSTDDEVKKHPIVVYLTSVVAAFALGWAACNEVVSETHKAELIKLEANLEGKKNTIKANLSKFEEYTSEIIKLKNQETNCISKLNTLNMKLNNLTQTSNRKPKRKYEFWAYYGLYKNGKFSYKQKPNFMIESGVDGKPSKNDKILALEKVIAREHRSGKARVLGFVCPNESVVVSEVSIIQKNKSEYIWVKVRDQLWNSVDECGFLAR